MMAAIIGEAVEIMRRRLYLGLGAQCDAHRQFALHSAGEFAGNDVPFILQL